MVTRTTLAYPRASFKLNASSGEQRLPGRHDSGNYFTPCRSLFRIGRHFPSFRESRPLKDDAVMYKAPSGYELGLYYYSDIF
jgi:hypothetical protein